MRKSTIWVPFVACAAAVLLGRQVGLHTSAALGFRIPALPPGAPMSLYDGRFAGGAYGGVGAFMAGWVIIAIGGREPKLRNPWLGLCLSVLVGIVFAFVGASLEGVSAR